MGKILIAWELGSGLGHITRIQSIVNSLIPMGHEVCLAACDLPTCYALMRHTNLKMIQAPISIEPRYQIRVPYTHTHILFNCGFAERERMAARIRSWCDLFEMIEPELIIADHSPSTLFAARKTATPVVVMGTGFEIPPGLPVLPNIRPRSQPDPEQLSQIEMQVLHHLNCVAGDLAIPAMENVSDLYYGNCKHLLLTYSELDPYFCRGRSEAARYWGIVRDDFGMPPQWPKGNGPRVFVYLKDHPILVSFLTRLAKLGLRAIVFAPPDVTLEHLRPHDGLYENILVSREPFAMKAISNESDFGIVHGGHGVTSEFLLAGKPILLFPTALEQQINGESVANIGAGICSSLNDIDVAIGDLMQLIGKQSYSDSAKQFSAKYEHLMAQSGDAIGKWIECIIRSGV